LSANLDENVQRIATGPASFRFAGSVRQFRIRDEDIPSNKYQKSESLDAPIRLGDAIQKLEDRLSLKIPTHSVLVLINGVEASILGGEDAIINPNDEVVIVPMFHGG
jgi:molybdopterin converting factor small subunit